MEKQMEEQVEKQMEKTTPNKYTGLGAAIAVELMIGFWFGIGVLLAVEVVDGLNYLIEAITTSGSS